MKKINKKIGEIQQKIGKIKKESENPFFKSKYFDINKLLDNLMPLLKEQGLTLTQPLTHVNERPAISTIITDGEESLESTITMPDIQDPQKMGSAITYYRRYALQSLFSLQAEDDDGNSASGNASQKYKTNNDLEI